MPNYRMQLTVTTLASARVAPAADAERWTDKVLHSLRAYPASLLLLLLSGLGCAHVATSSRARTVPNALPGVEVTFVRLARAVDFGQERMMEKGEPSESQQPGNTPWFRLSNHSGVTITIPTWSTYWRPLEEWDSLPGGKKVLSLKDGMQVSIKFAVLDAHGRVIPDPYDSFSRSRLKSGDSVLFSIPLGALEQGRTVLVEYQAEEPATGSDDGPTYRLLVRHEDIREPVHQSPVPSNPRLQPTGSARG